MLPNISRAKTWLLTEVGPVSAPHPIELKLWTAMKEHFQELFEYTHVSNSALIDVLLKNGNKIPEKLQIVFSHILNAHHIWNARILGQNELFKVWETQSFDQMENLDRKNFDLSFEILNKMDFTKSINYKNSKGMSFTRSLKDILFHVVNHSTYHRGQVAAQIREAGLEPVSTDFIFYKNR
jgi:uncharacterized damage-inducible protein DinB